MSVSLDNSEEEREKALRLIIVISLPTYFPFFKTIKFEVSSIILAQLRMGFILDEAHVDIKFN